MANFTAADVKRLREATGAGMLDCKNALTETGGDHDQAVEYLRVKGLKGVVKREGRLASNGLVAAHVDGGVGTLLELNCETDFVAKGERFQELAQKVLDQAVRVSATDASALMDSELADGGTVKELIDEANVAIGEKILIRRVARLQAGGVAAYLHKTSPDLPPQIGVLFGTDPACEVGRDVALHIAAMSPKYLTREDVPAELVAEERRIADETAREEGKPEKALPKIVEGRVNGFFKENVLVDQPFAREQKKTVAAVLAAAGATAQGFVRFRVGA
ncbi:MAG: elongation factor Ts [Actinomycetota bacterium]|nr:elongation factor Ts [Actinomycetota bacterium]